MTKRGAIRAMATAERLEFAALLESLSPAQWAADSLCAGWTVRDVAAHTLAYLDQSLPRLTVAMLRARGDVDGLNRTALEAGTRLAPAELATRMRHGSRPAGAGALYGGRVALIECLIHQQDIRRPLGLRRQIPEPRLVAAMNYARASPVIGAARRTRGVRLIATDIDWSAGSGEPVHGPAEALLLAMTGRVSAVAPELAGAGVTLLPW